MKDSREAARDEMCECHVCKKEVPRSTARSAEGRDYRYYFCGPGCEQRWLRERHNPQHVVKSE